MGFRNGVLEVWRLILLEMQQQEAAEFVDRLRQLTRAMRARDDAFGFHAAEVRTPVCHHPVRTIEPIALAAITDDRVVRDWRAINYWPLAALSVSLTVVPVSLSTPLVVFTWLRPAPTAVLAVPLPAVFAVPTVALWRSPSAMPEPAVVAVAPAVLVMPEPAIMAVLGDLKCSFKRAMSEHRPINLLQSILTA